jgi:aryl-alcohol dehydrogenase-like predicted oxidoreductase
VRLILSPLTGQTPTLLVRLPGLTIGTKVGADPAKDIIKVAFENGINMFDTAEAYNKGGGEFELYFYPFLSLIPTLIY